MSSYLKLLMARGTGIDLAMEGLGHCLCRKKMAILILSLTATSGCGNKDFEFRRTPESLVRVQDARVQINEDAPYTQDAHVGLSIRARNAVQMKISHQVNCQDGVWQPYSEAQAWTLFGENGVQHVYLQFMSPDKIVSDCISDSIVHDNLPPRLKWVKIPKPWSSDLQTTFQLLVSDPESGERGRTCQLKGGGNPWACGESFTVKLKNEGPQDVQVVVEDHAGNVAKIDYNWKLDTRPPRVRLVEHPDAISGQAQARFTFVGDDQGSGISSFECRSDQGAFSACLSPLVFPGLGEGGHSFQVRARDFSDNVSEPAMLDWQIDLSPPSVRLVSGPGAYTRSSDAELRVLVDDQVAGVERIFCQLDTEKERLCGEHDQLNRISEGQHQWSVWATDKVGNQSARMTHSWIVDQTPPEIIWKKVPSNSEAGSGATFLFEVRELGSGLAQVACAVDGRAQACAAGAELVLHNLAIGRHNFRVDAIDKAGNQSTVEQRWQVDPSLEVIGEVWDITNYGAVDLLFVVDSSVSMKAERAEMGRRFSDLMNEMAGLDWQIAMTTTDVANNTERSQGRLMNFRGLQTSILSAAMDPSVAWSAFRDTIADAQGGSNQERGIFATHLALERRKIEAVAQQFFRQSSNLEVVVVTDADNSGNESADQPQNLISQVAQVFGLQKLFAFHSIIILPGDEACKQQGETFGQKYFDLSASTKGVVGSVCSENYTQIVSQIGKRIRERHRERRLKCNPYDQDQDGKPDVTLRIQNDTYPPIEWQVQGNTIVFDRFLPLGRHEIGYQCVKPVP